MLGAFPIGDWQFWAVTLAAVAAAAWLLRSVLPIPLIGKPRRKRGQTRATLTVDGKPVSRP